MALMKAMGVSAREGRDAVFMSRVILAGFATDVAFQKAQRRLMLAGIPIRTVTPLERP
jgi:hypothetical protein